MAKWDVPVNWYDIEDEDDDDFDYYDEYYNYDDSFIDEPITIPVNTMKELKEYMQGILKEFFRKYLKEEWIIKNRGRDIYLNVHLNVLGDNDVKIEKFITAIIHKNDENYWLMDFKEGVSEDSCFNFK